MDNFKKNTDICFKNIVRTRLQAEAAELKTRAHLNELALLISERMPKDPSEEKGEEFRRFYNELCGELNREEKIILCSCIAQNSDISAFTGRLLNVKKPKRDATVVYVKNALSDIAFEKLSKSFNKAQVYYAADFEEALEDVYYSKADYAILPVASSKNGRIQHFTELALRHEMKTVCSCTVHSNTDESDNTFVLLSKNIEFFFSQGDKGIRFEFLLNDPSDNLTSVLMAAQSYGCSYITAYTAPENVFALTELDITKGEREALCLYLFLEFSRHIPQGFFKII